MSARAQVEAITALATSVGDALDGVLSDAELLHAADEFGELRRRVDALGVALASRVIDRPDPLPCHWSGVRGATSVLTVRAGLEHGEAHAMAVVAEATTARMSLQGESLPPIRPSIADALERGLVGPGAASRICATLDDLGIGADQASGVERTLVDHAPSLTGRELRKLCGQILDRYTPEQAELREEVLRSRSGLRMTTLPDGTSRWTLTLHPEAEGLLLTALNARTAPRRTPTFADPDAPADLEPDPRPMHQRRLDALVDIARESLAHDQGQVAGSPVTALVMIPLETLRTGLGTAHIAGVDQPICAATARRLAADAEIIPVVLGSDSVPLDLGRAVRIATPAQRRALVIRDGGCARCGAPPGWCEVAHIHPWWDGGPTDLDNLILMCPRCHHDFDAHGWTVEWRDGIPWFIPPRHVDPTRTPIRGRGLPRVA